MTSLFHTAILSICRHCTEIKTFLECWDQTSPKMYVFWNINSKIWRYVTRGRPYPSPVVDLHGVRLQNGFEFWILRAKVTINHVLACPKESFWFWWLFVAWPWPWPCLVWHLYSQGIFTSPLAFWGHLTEFRAKAIDIAGPRLHHTKTSKIDLWPDLDPRFKVNLKIISTLWRDLVERFRTPHRGARCDHWFLR